MQPSPLHYSCLGNPKDRGTWATWGHMTQQLSNKEYVIEIESIVNNLTKQKAPSPDGFSEFYEIFKEKVISLQSHLKNRSRGNTFSFILWGQPNIKTSQRHHEEKTLQINLSHEHRCKNPPQNTSKLNPKMYKMNYTPCPLTEFIPDMQVQFNI